MGRNNAEFEDFIRNAGHKISVAPMGRNRYTQKCFECGSNVYRSMGWAVKPEGDTKFRTVCRVCGNQWHSRDNLEDPRIKEVLSQRIKYEQSVKAQEAAPNDEK